MRSQKSQILENPNLFQRKIIECWNEAGPNKVDELMANPKLGLRGSYYCCKSSLCFSFDIVDSNEDSPKACMCLR